MSNGGGFFLGPQRQTADVKQYKPRTRFVIWVLLAVGETGSLWIRSEGPEQFPGLDAAQVTFLSPHPDSAPGLAPGNGRTETTGVILDNLDSTDQTDSACLKSYCLISA